MVSQRGSEAASAKRPSEGNSSVQDALDRVAKRLKVKRQTLLKELQAEFRLPVSNAYPTALPPDYGSQIYDWLDAHDDEDESDSEDYSDVVEARNKASSVNHLPILPDAQKGQASREKGPPPASFEPARPVSQEEERKALLGIFRASTDPGKDKGRQSIDSFYFGSNNGPDFSPPAASKKILDTSDTESVNSFLQREEGCTELAFEPKTTTTHSPEAVSRQPKAMPSRPRGPELMKKAIENDSRRKETNLSTPFVTASKRKSHEDDDKGTAITTTPHFVTKLKRRNLVDNDDDESIREMQGVETEAVKLFEGFFGYSPTSDPWKAHSLAKGPGDLDKSVYRHQTMARRVAAVMVGAPTKWVSFTVLPSARRPVAPVRFRNAPSWPLVRPTVKNQTQAYQIYPVNRSIQVISEGLANRRGEEFKQRQSEKARQIWEKRKEALALDLKVPEESVDIQRGSLPPPFAPPQRHVSLRYPDQAQRPDDEERDLTQAAPRPGNPAQYVAKAPYTPRSVLGANAKSLADIERAKAYYQTHREKLREAKARQHKYALDRSRIDL